ncbi:MAG: hypothetical protein H5T85_03430 [Actinobacteria bacterium]|nr:hypothetical protein [Actinomycetota bacterium]
MAGSVLVSDKEASEGRCTEQDIENVVISIKNTRIDNKVVSLPRVHSGPWVNLILISLNFLCWNIEKTA